ncbi:MAG: thymidine kinase [Deltaproteobacteria bacterium]|nr:thymidine kinase [Deltaproteobacteria bacterium]
MIASGRAIGGGVIEVICGPMFSGKTEELIRRLRLARIAKQRTQIFKPGVDDRYESEHITSHIEQKYLCTPVKETRAILEKLADNTRVVGIDEAQFFGNDLVELCEKLANRGLRVIVAGLDQDYLGNPFGPMPQLLAIADDLQKLKAVCMVCGAEATKSQRLTEDKDQVVVGAGEQYEARCRVCFDPDLSLEKSTPKRPMARV